MTDQDAVRNSVRHLAALGFTELEATVYAYLVQHSPATAYRVAQGIGKPVANTYKAVESLAHKGAVLVDETGENRMCRAVAPDELLLRLRETFAARERAAAGALAELRRPDGDDGIFALSSVEQVFGRCARMLEGAANVVLLDGFPEALERLRPGIESAAARGVLIVVQAYAPIDLGAAETVVQPRSEQTLRRWPGQWLCVVADGAEYLFGYMDRAGAIVHQAIWSASAFLAWVNHSYLAGSIREQLIRGLVESGADAKDLRSALDRSERWFAPNAPGYRALRERFGMREDGA